MQFLRAFTGLALMAITAGCGGANASGSSASAGSSNGTVRIAIATDGSTTFDGKKATGAELTNLARDAVRARSDVHFVVDAEREVSFQNLMGVVERVRAGGTQNVSLGTIVATSTAPSSHGDPTTKASGAPPTTAAPATGPTPEPHASIAVGTKWDCPFPPASDRNGKDEANVLVVVHVESDGKPLSVDVLEDPGGGYATAAKRCALEKAYVPPKDINGKPLRATTFPFFIHFVMH